MAGFIGREFATVDISLAQKALSAGGADSPSVVDRLETRSIATAPSGGGRVNQRDIGLGALTVVGLLILLFAAIVLIPRLLYPPLSAADLRGVLSAQSRIQLQQAQSQLANDARSTLLQGLGGLLLVVGAIATWRQVHVSREGQITERFTRAVDQLGNQNVDVRIGGIYALERIAKNSRDDRSAIQYLLGAFVRHNASWPVSAANGPQHPTAEVDKNRAWMTVRAPDIQAAAGILGRLPDSPDASALYLSRTDLRGIQLGGAELTGTKMRHANFARAQLRGTRLDGCDLEDTDLRMANLEHAHLSEAILRRAYLQEADLREADLSRADLHGADLTGTILTGTVFTGARADRTTVWPAGLDDERRHELGIIEDETDDPDHDLQLPA
jgi:Pentapeptide repeats (8 copies)